MGYDLSNPSGGYIEFTGSGWDLALAIAKHYGWEPVGIPKPASWNDANGPWEDEYWINAGQQVTPEDASAMAGALERAVASSDFIETLLRIKDQMNEQLAARNPKWRDDLQPPSHEQAEGFRKRLVEFAAFARQGPFVIE